MRGSHRALGLGLTLLLTGLPGPAAAQDVVVTRAPQGSTVELFFEGQALGSATVDTRGIATLDASGAPRRAGQDQVDVRFFVDTCGEGRAVRIVTPGALPPPPAQGCTRREAPGVYVMTGVTTFVVDVSRPAPRVFLRQGSVPASWLDPTAPEPGAARTWEPPTGLTLFAGVDFAGLGDAVTLACGSAPSCAGGGTEFAANGGATFWLTRHVAAEVAYLGVRDIVIDGGGDGFAFNSNYELRLVSLSGKLGGPVGPMRLYGRFGAAHHRLTLNTSQTIDDRTVTVEDTPTVLVGGTQTFGMIVSGWSWSAGGGLEGWVKPMFGLYAEFGYTPVKGGDDRGGEGRVDDRVIQLGGGITVRLWR